LHIGYYVYIKARELIFISKALDQLLTLIYRNAFSGNTDNMLGLYMVTKTMWLQIRQNKLDNLW